MTEEQAEECCNEAVESWYNEKNNFSFKSMKKVNKKKTIAHFIQVVWKNSVDLGVGIARRSDGNVIGKNDPLSFKFDAQI